jgi:outer membrane protein TolC
MSKYLIYTLFLLFSFQSFSQDANLGMGMSLNELLGYVKAYHPVARQAELKITEAQAKLMRARGNFDPKIGANLDQKEFNDSDYFQLFDAGLTIPVWFGLDVKAGYERNEGVFLNPERMVPDDGLFKAGISLPIGQGLFINDRMATLKQAKLVQTLNEAQRDLQVNEILFQATNAYVNWLQARKEVVLFEDFLANAKIRFEGIKESALQGQIPIIDTTEAKIIVQSRELGLEQAQLSFTQHRLELSNFLWIDDEVPLEIIPEIIPEEINPEELDEVLGTNLIMLENFDVQNHPLLRFIEVNIESLDIERRLAAERLKPVLDVQYNFLSETPNQFNSFTPNNYQAGISFSMPLFLRKERGDLKLAKLRIQDATLEYDFVNFELKNNINLAQQEIVSFQKQFNTSASIARDFTTLLNAEERKFSFGESSVFLINAREQQLIEARLSEIRAIARWHQSKAKLFRLLANQLTLED